MLPSYIDIDNWEDYVVIDPEFYRPCEVEYLKGVVPKRRNWDGNRNVTSRG